MGGKDGKRERGEGDVLKCREVVVTHATWPVPMVTITVMSVFLPYVFKQPLAHIHAYTHIVPKGEKRGVGKEISLSGRFLVGCVRNKGDTPIS